MNTNLMLVPRSHFLHNHIAGCIFFIMHVQEIEEIWDFEQFFFSVRWNLCEMCEQALFHWAHK